MAAEYKLKFTAEEIERRLESIGEGGNGGSYVAGDGIEIKDDVIRSTLGDFIGTETEEVLVELYHTDNIEMGDQGDGTYVVGCEGALTNPIDTNEKLTVKFELSDGAIKTFDVDLTSEYNDDEGLTYILGLYNCVASDDGLVKVDENLDALYLEGAMTKEMFGMVFVTLEDYTGASVTISQSGIVERNVYATLPENALIAGDGIEIENGIIRSTLGDVIGTVDTFNELLRIDNLELEGEDGDYYWEGLVDNVPDFGEVVSVYLTLPGEDTPVHYSSEAVDFDGEGYYRYVFCNIDPDTFEMPDPSLPSFAILFINYEEYGEEIKFATMVAFGDYNGATLVVGTGGVETKYVTLPDNALKTDKFIEIKDGKIRLTLGDAIKTERSVSILDEEIYWVTKHETIDNLYSSGQFTSDNAPVLETRVNIELTLANSDQPIVYENIGIDEYGAYDEWNNYYDYTCMVANTDQWCGSIVNNGFASKDDDTIPALMIRGYIDDDKGYYRVYVYASEDISGARIKVTNNYTQTDYVKLPKGALGFDIDWEPERDSSNLVTSGGVYEYIKNNSTPNLYYDSVPTQHSSNLVTSGVIYNALQDVKPNLSYDSTPTAGSQNLVRSGDIYTAIQDAIGDIDSVIAEINSRIGGAS